MSLSALFLVYQLRRLSLEAKLILVVGYGFADEHINGILQQALRGRLCCHLKNLVTAPTYAILAIVSFGENAVQEFISEDDLKTFEGWLKYQGVNAATTATHELNMWRSL
jgi:hypothetical protein